MATGPVDSPDPSTSPSHGELPVERPPKRKLFLIRLRPRLEKKHLFWFGIMLFVGVAVLVVALEPTQVIRGFLRRETFYHGRPTSYWKENLREDGHVGGLRAKTVERLTADQDSVPILMDCLHDPDKDVRWSAASLLSQFGPREDVAEALTEALRDDDSSVRYHAVLSLGLIGEGARSSVPALVGLNQDPDPRVQWGAYWALWRIDIPTALKEGGWKKFVSSKWHCAAVFPGIPQRKEESFPTPLGLIQNHSLVSRQFTDEYFIDVYEYPQKFLQIKTGDEILKFMGNPGQADGTLKLISDHPVDLSGHPGRETVFETKDLKMINRLFFEKGLLYRAYVLYEKNHANISGIHYFLDSFRLE